VTSAPQSPLPWRYALAAVGSEEPGWTIFAADDSIVCSMMDVHDATRIVRAVNAVQPTARPDDSERGPSGPKVIRVTSEGRREVDPATIIGSKAAEGHLKDIERIVPGPLQPERLKASFADLLDRYGADVRHLRAQLLAAYNGIVDLLEAERAKGAEVKRG
jgi:hypothetical protein